MANYLCVWGGAAEAVRHGSGNGEDSAALEAFGVYQPERQTIMQVATSVVTNDTKRTRFIAQVLLPEHIRKMEARKDPAAVNLTQFEIGRITRLWQASWARQDQRKAKQ